MRGCWPGHCEPGRKGRGVCCNPWATTLLAILSCSKPSDLHDMDCHKHSRMSAPTLRIGLYLVMLRTLGPGLHKSLKLLSWTAGRGVLVTRTPCTRRNPRAHLGSRLISNDRQEKGGISHGLKDKRVLYIIKEKSTLDL